MKRADKDLFFEALDLAGAERAAFLDRIGKEDAVQRARIEDLLADHTEVGDFMEQAAVNDGGKPVNEKFGEGAIIGRYKLLEKLGEGGFGEVYVAEQKEPVKRRVAIKVIKLGMDTRQVVARFEAERQALAMMEHPNIARVLDAGATDSGRPYFAMELVRGVRITHYCEENKLPILDRLNLFIQVGRAIQHAHQKGIIHRDIKPSNIIVTLHDGVPVPKVIDFGIAKAIEGDLTDKTIYTQYHQFIGTPAYMSPEQAEMSGLDVDTRTDIYALGVLLYELLTGETPFDGKELVNSGIDQMRRTIREKEPLRPSTRLRLSRAKTAAPPLHLAQFGSDLDWIVMKCLEKDRTRRYETANGLVKDLERHLNHEPINARAPSQAYRLQKAWQRNRLLFSAILVIAVVLIVATFVSLSQAAKATRAGAFEKQERLRADAEKLAAERNLYIANMSLTQHAWEKNMFASVRQFLDETASYPNRGFEWFYFQRRLNMQSQTLAGHVGTIQATAWSRDGARIVTTGSDRTVRIWDARSGTQILLLTNHTDLVTSISFAADGKRFATGSLDHTVRLWDIDTGQQLSVLQHTGRVWSVDYSADSRRIVTGEDQRAYIWDAQTGNHLGSIREGSRAVFSPDSSRIAVSTGRNFKICDAVSGQILKSFPNKAWLTAMSYTPDGTKIISTWDDGTVFVFDAENCQVLATFTAHKGVAFNMAVSGKRFATSGADGLLRIWDAETFEALLAIKGSTTALHTVAFSPDGQRLLSAAGNGLGYIWRADRSGAGEPIHFPLFEAFVYSACFSADGKKFLASGHVHEAGLWDAETGKQIVAYRGHSQSLSGALFFPDEKRVATVSVDGFAKIFDTASGRELRTFSGHNGPVYTLAISPDGQKVLTCSSTLGWAESRNLTGKIWNPDTGEVLLTVTNMGRWAAFSPDGRRVASGGDGPLSKVWDSATGQELLTLPGYNGPVAYSADGRRLVTAHDNTTRVWNAQTGAPLATLHGITGTIHSVAFSKDGTRILTASVEGTGRLWDAESGKELLTLTGPSASASSAHFSPDETRIIAATWTGVWIWDSASRTNENNRSRQP